MSSEKCTWLIEAVINEETEEVKSPEHVCNKTATVVYVKRNPRAREPDQPAMLRYPRCRTHDTNEARRVAPAQGYDIVDL